jgi:hypothetical protein
MKLALSLSGLLFVCRCTNVVQASPSHEICSENGAVLKVVIEQIVEAKAASGHQIVVLYGETLGGQLLDVERKLQFDQPALANLRQRNVSAETLPVCFSEGPVIVIAPYLARKLWQPESSLETSPQFARIFPAASGMYSFHLPGYTSDGGRALVHYMWTAGPLAVESVWVSLLKRHGKWSIEWQTTDWVS